MAQEIRKIAFNIAEIHAALEIFAGRTQQKIPEEPVSAIQEEGSRLSVMFGEDQSKSFSLQAREMIAALLVFCQAHNIPVPRDGKKVLKLDGDTLALLIRTS